MEGTKRDNIARISFVDGKKLSASECNKQALSQTFSVDLVEAALAQIEFLSSVNKYPALSSVKHIQNTRRRYEQLWLPLAAEHAQERLTAPLDIEWLWHCHLLCPVTYEKDCETLFGATINHRLVRNHDREYVLKRSKQLWNEKYKNEPFEVDLTMEKMLDASSGIEFKSSISYDLEAAISRQSCFYYNVSLPHYRDRKFLTLSVQRYQKFLFLRKNSYKLFIVPCYDQDLIWHTHQLHPLAYKDDTTRLLGKVLVHDDTTVDRSPDSKLTLSTIDTRRLWREMYQEDFNTPGAMYRGPSPEELYSPICAVDDRTHSRLGLQLKLESISIDRIPDGEYGLDFTLQIFLAEDQNKTRKPTFELFGPTMVWTANELFSCSLHSQRWLIFHLKVRKGTIFSREVIVGKGKIDLHLLLDRSSVHCFQEAVSLEGEDKNLAYVSGCITELYPDMYYSFKTGKLSVCVVPHDIDRVFPIESTKLEPKECGAGYVAQHRFISENAVGDIECRFVYSPHRSEADIQFIQNGKIVCSAKTVDSIHLPLSYQVSNPNWYATLDPRLGERAVLIRETSGDWAVLTGRWISSQDKKEGYLSVKLHKLVDKSIQYINVRVPNSEEEHFCIHVDNNVFDMEGSDFCLRCRFDESLQYLATGLSIFLLLVLCMPRPTDKTKTEAEVNELSHVVGSKFLVGCGFHVITSSNNSTKEK
ncbi:uncharacterized protein LOC133187497 [Saccostrea echinata]|uniref:uncharacterized protein LOC133187497 n=1 Tax=Saccostrea echinata TaxID=191078 RepID=UPI002A7FDF97|nr:uncharacterized protein LOC133187497 [Saccostrea echinata]